MRGFAVAGDFMAKARAGMSSCKTDLQLGAEHFESFTNAPWLAFPQTVSGSYATFENFSLHLPSGFLCGINSWSCTNRLENVGFIFSFLGGHGTRGGGNPPSAAPGLGLQRKLRPPAPHRKQSSSRP